MAEKRCPLNREQLEALAQRFPTPFHLYDEAGIRVITSYSIHYTKLYDSAAPAVRPARRPAGASATPAGAI